MSALTRLCGPTTLKYGLRDHLQNVLPRSSARTQAFSIRHCLSNSAPPSPFGNMIHSPTPQHPSSWNWIANQLDIATKSPEDPANTAEAKWKDRSDRILPNIEPPHNAYTGRSVRVTFRDGAASALHRLQILLRRNQVIAEYRSQERHEKKGEKRRRLESVRWRRRFAHEVRKKVQLVNEIRARGA
ncbi:hypothetical protein OBBRIDRAFT_535832 [Obba rivulosa]|uniref:Ribosomal protein S21 n=1 Tax=Obba rivulosa TaxID=1052685 RepID=A0A8E2DTF2_9APHY|nr:hypothetical protein OBBRIDRAFT_535832 [Obba rivulosa]